MILEELIVHSLLILGSQSPRRRELLAHLPVDFVTDVANCDEQTEFHLPELSCQQVAKNKGEALVVRYRQVLNKMTKESIAELLEFFPSQKLEMIILTSDTMVVLPVERGFKDYLQLESWQNKYKIGEWLKDRQSSCKKEDQFSFLHLSKPQDVDQARLMLQLLSGKVHEVYTGVHFFKLSLEVKDLTCILNVVETKGLYEKTKVEFVDIDSKILEYYLKTGDSLDKAGAYGIQGAGLPLVKSLSGSYANVVGLPLNLVWDELRNLSDTSEQISEKQLVFMKKIFSFN